MVNLPGFKVSSYELKKPFMGQLNDSMRVGVKHKRASYRREFDIERSWIPSNNDVTESMLSYSRRMSDINKQRGFLTKPDDRLELPLLIKATHLPHPNIRPRSQNKARRSSNNQGSYAARARSLPNMKLEPLLGTKAKEYQMNTASLVDLKSVKGVKLQFPRSKYPIDAFNSDSNQSESQIVEEQPLTHQLVETPDTQMKDNSSEPIVEVSYIDKHSQLEPLRESQFTDAMTIDQKTDQRYVKPLRHVSKTKRKKRLVIPKSYLESIDEDDAESVASHMSRRDSYNKVPLPKIYNPGATLTEQDSYLNIQQSLEERRRDVALLRKISNSINSSKASSYMSMQSLAKKKLRRLPPMLANIQTDIKD